MVFFLFFILLIRRFFICCLQTNSSSAPTGHHKESIFDVFLCADPVCRFHIRAPAVDAADAPDRAEDTQYCPPGYWQFFLMQGIFQLRRRTRQTGKRKSPSFLCLKPKKSRFGGTVPVIQGPAPSHFHPGRIHMHPAVLRNQIRSNRKSVHLIYSGNSSRFPIRVSLSGQPFISKTIGTGRHEKTHAEDRKFRKSFLSMVTDSDPDHSRTIYPIRDFHPGRRNRDGLTGVADLDLRCSLLTGIPVIFRRRRERNLLFVYPYINTRSIRFRIVIVPTPPMLRLF